MTNSIKSLRFPFLNKVFNKTNLSKVLIIFIIGFISRSIINYTYEVHVFLDYTNSISIMYYTFMAFISIVIHELINYFNLPTINHEVFNISSIRKGISRIISNRLHGSKIFLYGEKINLDLYKDDSSDKFSSVLFKGESNTSKGKSAGVRGLYSNSRGGSGTPAKVQSSYSSAGTRSSSISSSSMYFMPDKNGMFVRCKNSGVFVNLNDGCLVSNNGITRAPVMSNLTTPSTMSPLFPPSVDSNYTGQSMYTRPLCDSNYRPSHDISRPSYVSMDTTHYNSVHCPS